MSIQHRLIALRRERDLTQQEMVDTIGAHVNQVRRYEAGAIQPSLEVLKKIALATNITIDSLVFNNQERGSDEELKLQFEAVTQMPPQEKQVIKTLLEGMILKHQTRQMVDDLSN